MPCWPVALSIRNKGLVLAATSNGGRATRRLTMREFPTRRAFLAGSLAVTLHAQNTGKLTARPGASSAATASGLQPPGLHPLGLRTDRDALLYIPVSAAKREKAPLIVSLH